ncbi:zeta toxin family protein [Terracidiphilus sp.]|uniref:zeta toxin family protein n=1 Tax=Terracidiphilus sp. TaxID=1964191 RepID=UPI003C19C336
MSAKDIVILGEPSGAGKTTAARALLRDALQGIVFLNADEIARQISPYDPDSAALTAGRVFIKRMRDLVRRGSSFAFETTCSGKSYIRLLAQCKQDGWRITLFYFWLPSPEYSIERVARRVLQGGHHIPTDVIYRRYKAGISNMRHLYLPLADEAEIFDNSDKERRLIVVKRKSVDIQILDTVRWAVIEGIAQ